MYVLCMFVMRHIRGMDGLEKAVREGNRHNKRDKTLNVDYMDVNRQIIRWGFQWGVRVCVFMSRCSM